MTWRMVSPRSVRNIQFGILGVGLIWGLDYILPPDDDSKVLTIVEQKSLLPLGAWGALMIAAGLVGLISELLLNRSFYRYQRWWIGSFVAHTFFAAVYFMLAAGAFAAVFQSEAGFRTPVLWALVGGIHSAYARRIDATRMLV